MSVGGGRPNGATSFVFFLGGLLNAEGRRASPMRRDCDTDSVLERDQKKTKTTQLTSREMHMAHKLGCSFPVKCRFVYAISANIFGKADGGGLARQRKQTDISQESYSPDRELSNK